MIINKAMSTDAVAANVQKGKNVAEDQFSLDAA
jgi:hypothetical protein